MTVAHIQPFACIVPAGTPQASPAVFQMDLLQLEIGWLEWTVPDGPMGQMGFWIGSHGQQIIPYASGNPVWIVSNDERVHWDLIDQPDSGDWELQAYNLGNSDHTVYVRWGLYPKQQSTGGLLIPSALLSSP